ncbi:MAG: hypothetical protein DRR19_05300 [Candidatus Parabeggiatoa sp. nov. 1]|nr:MAG: hypothetical protein DRR19_05300 [Gammaproteobacteria bacterium]
MNRINVIIILIVFSWPLLGQATNLTAQLRLTKTSFIDNQGQLIQSGIVQGYVQLNGIGEQLVWAALKLPEGLIQGQVFQTAEQNWLLDVSLTPLQLTLLEKSLKSSARFYILAVNGEYQALVNAPYEVTFDWSLILTALKTDPINTIEHLQQRVNRFVENGVIQSSEQLNDRTTKAIVFTLRRQLFEYYQTAGQLAIRLRYPLPRLSKPTKTLIHSPVYLEQARLFPVEVIQQSAQEWTDDGYRIQTIRFYTAIDLKQLGIRAIALQTEMIDNKGYRQPGKVLIIRKHYKLYKQTFTMTDDFKQYRLVYWGKVFLENGAVVNWPQTQPMTFSVPIDTEELSHLVSPLLSESGFSEFKDFQDKL